MITEFFHNIRLIFYTPSVQAPSDYRTAEKRLFVAMQQNNAQDADVIDAVRRAIFNVARVKTIVGTTGPEILSAIKADVNIINKFNTRDSISAVNTILIVAKPPNGNGSYDSNLTYTIIDDDKNHTIRIVRGFHHVLAIPYRMHEGVIAVLQNIIQKLNKDGAANDTLFSIISPTRNMNAAKEMADRLSGILSRTKACVELLLLASIGAARPRN